MSVNTKMTALADEIRELSGVSEAIGLDAMKTYVNDANTDVATEANLIEQIASALEGKAAGGEQATPKISVNTSGLITATAGTKSSTHQLAFQPAKTITPSSTNQIAVSSGYYTGGNITVIGDSNLVADNIKSGVSIFGVSGTLVEGDIGEQAEWSENEDAIVNCTISNYINNRVTNVGSYAFYRCSSLKSVSFPACIAIGNGAFEYCSSLTTISFPVCTSIGYSAFQSCTSLTSVNFPACTYIGNSAFSYCTKLVSVNFPAYSTTIRSYIFPSEALTTISFPVCTSIGSYAFDYCKKLEAVNFPKVTTISKNAFQGCSSLTTADFPKCTTIGEGAFAYCSKLTTVNFPECTTIGEGAFFADYGLVTITFPKVRTIGSNAFNTCPSLVSVNFPACTSIGNTAFYCCSNLTTFILSGSSVPTLENTDAFAQGTRPWFYVPASLISIYQTTTNWAAFSTRFLAYDNNSNGDNNGDSSSTLITFTIDGTEYQAEEGMTWVVWVESEYNTDGYEYKYSRIIRNGISITNIDAYDTIINGNSYYTDD